MFVTNPVWFITAEIREGRSPPDLFKSSSTGQDVHLYTLKLEKLLKADTEEAQAAPPLNR